MACGRWWSAARNARSGPSNLGPATIRPRASASTPSGRATTCWAAPIPCPCWAGSPRSTAGSRPTCPCRIGGRRSRPWPPAPRSTAPARLPTTRKGPWSAPTPPPPGPPTPPFGRPPAAWQPPEPRRPGHPRAAAVRRRWWRVGARLRLSGSGTQAVGQHTAGRPLPGRGFTGGPPPVAGPLGPRRLPRRRNHRRRAVSELPRARLQRRGRRRRALQPRLRADPGGSGDAGDQPPRPGAVPDLRQHRAELLSAPEDIPARRRLALPKAIVATALALLALIALVLIGARYGVLLPQTRLLLEAGADGLTVGRFGRLKLEGLSGDVWRDISVRKLTLRDEGGVWLEADNLHMTWHYVELLTRNFHADRIELQALKVLRRPTLTPKGEDTGLPVSFHIDRAHARVEMAPAFSYRRGAYALDLTPDGA